MTMLQHYYTSCVHGTTGSAGFQVKALSPGITAEEQRLINGLIGYRIPHSLDVYDVAHHPIALRYDYLSTERCILSCSQSNGGDENGRPGNFFAHTVITSPQDFEILSPIMFWRHQFWRTQDASDHLTIPLQPNFALEPSLEIDQIWPFLDHANRRNWFRQLLAAVINYDQKRRPIVILDDIDNIACWIAALTFALPTIYRPLLTFATYHHDPYQVPFRIIGTTRDGKFRFSTDEYITYFVLDTETERISETPATAYADFVADHFQPDLYEETLLGFFGVCNNRLRVQGRRWAARLDPQAHFYLAIREKQLSLADHNAQQSVKLFLDEVETQTTILLEDLTDLQSMLEGIAKDLLASPNGQLITSYGRVLHLLKRFDPDFVHRCRQELKLLTISILQGRETLANQLATLYQELYGEQLSQLASRPEYIADLTKELPQRDGTTYALLWQHLGPLFRYDASSAAGLLPLIEQTLYMAENLPEPDGDELIVHLVNANQNEKQKPLMDGAIAWRRQRNGRAFVRLYVLLVAPVSLEKREHYRQYLIENSAPVSYEDLIGYEVEHEVRTAGSNNLTGHLGKWIYYLAGKIELQQQVVTQSLTLTWPTSSQARQQLLAEQLLASEIISPHLEQPWVTRLLNTYLSNLTLKALDGQGISLYEKYLNHSDLTIEQRAIIGGILALSTGRFYDKTIPILRRWLGQANDATYQQAAAKLVPRFFEGNFTLESHVEMLQAVYIKRYEQVFWTNYWSSFKKLLGDTSRLAKLIDLLSFWFDKSQPLLQDQEHLTAGFFLHLPSTLMEIRENKSSRNVLQQVVHGAARESWFPLLRPYLVEGEHRSKPFNFWRR